MKFSIEKWHKRKFAKKDNFLNWFKFRFFFFAWQPYQG